MVPKISKLDSAEWERLDLPEDVGVKHFLESMPLLVPPGSCCSRAQVGVQLAAELAAPKLRCSLQHPSQSSVAAYAKSAHSATTAEVMKALESIKANVTSS